MALPIVSEIDFKKPGGIQGIPGIQGPIGPAGPQGPQGPIGSQVFHGWKLFKSATQTLNGNAVNTITWSSTAIDTDGYKSGNAVVIPITLPGVYLIRFEGVLNPTPQCTQINIRINIDGADKTETLDTSIVSLTYRKLTSTMIYELAAGQGIRIDIIPVGGNADLVSDNTPLYTRFEGIYLGPIDGGPQQ
jgi:hypothetical protein